MVLLEISLLAAGVLNRVVGVYNALHVVYVLYKHLVLGLVDFNFSAGAHLVHLVTGIVKRNSCPVGNVVYRKVEFAL